MGNSLDLLGPDQSNHCEVAKSGCGAAEQEKSILKTAGVKSKIARGGVEYRVRRGFSIPDRLCGIRFPYPISCQATVVLQLENPVRIIERSGPLQEPGAALAGKSAWKRKQNTKWDMARKCHGSCRCPSGVKAAV